MDALTTNEVVALFGLDERIVRKEVEHGILGVGSPPRFDLPAVVYLRALSSLGFEMGKLADRKRLHEMIRKFLGMQKRPAAMELSPNAP